MELPVFFFFSENFSALLPESSHNLYNSNVVLLENEPYDLGCFMYQLVH